VTETTTGENTIDGADVEPDKRLFISMLTRDIDLIPAILDLWDNSLDGALRFLPDDARSEKLSGFRIDITISAEGFRIRDNSGGITLDDARNRAFKLGRPKDVESVAHAVGIFGVGMKRALFKMGNQFSVQSRSVAGDFDLEVNVTEWADGDRGWLFPFTSVDENAVGAPPDATSTEIVVTDLFPQVAAQFQEEELVKRLRFELATRRNDDHFGVKTYLNAEYVKPYIPKLVMGSDVKPAIIAERVAPKVSVTLRAGVVKSNKAEESQDEGDGADWKGRDEGGWYVRANGRVLLAAEKSRLTGWGDETARYHPQYRTFRGYVDIESSDGSLLPWNTTKTGVDENSAVWQATYGLMKKALIQNQAFLNRLKDEVTEARDSGEEGVLMRAIGAAELQPVESIPADKTSSMKYPTPSVAKAPTKRISFTVPVERFDLIAEALELDDPKGPDLGRALFERVWAWEVDQ
jgi:hypothetical protein